MKLKAWSTTFSKDKGTRRKGSAPGIKDPEAKVLMGSLMPKQIEQDLHNFLRTRSKTIRMET